MALTDKKRRFVDALLSGVTKREAAIAAGYSAKTASQAGSKLAKDPDVLTAFGEGLHRKNASSEKVKPGQKVKGLESPGDDDGKPSFEETDDPRAFLTALMNEPGVELRMRADAAKTLMPYVHGKVADQGKKELKDEAAKKAGKGRYAQSKPPSLKVVKG